MWMDDGVLSLRGDPQQPDGVLWARAAAGDANAFGAIFDRYGDAVYNFVFRRTGSWDVAEDTVSSVFLEAWRQRDTIVLHQGSLRPWLFGVAHNVVRRWWRTNRRTAVALPRIAALTDTSDHLPDIAARVDDERTLRVVLRRLGALPENQREVLLLWAWEQLTYDEIAIVLSVPIGTVRSRLNRARGALTGDDGTRLDPWASTGDARAACSGGAPRTTQGGGSSE